MSLDARSFALSVIVCGCDPILFAGVLVDPTRLQPFLGIGFVRRNQVEALGVGAGRVSKRPNVRGKKEVEWLDLVPLRLSSVERCQRPHDGWAADRYSPDSR